MTTLTSEKYLEALGVAERPLAIEVVAGESAFERAGIRARDEK
jgi:hypothetical protein